MSQSLTLKIKGLHTYPSDLSEVPEGSLEVADEIVIDRESVAEPRRGFGYLTHGAGVQTQFSDASYRANKIFFYQNKILCHYATNLFAYHNSSTGWVNKSGTFNPPSSTIPVRSAQANKNFYMTTNLGVVKLDSYTANATPVGVPQALDIVATLAISQAITFDRISASKVLTNGNTVGTTIGIGMSVTGTGIPANTYVVSFNGTTLTMNNAATSSAAGGSYTFAPTTTWLATAFGGNNTVNYRILWAITDANKNFILGAPSGIQQFSNLSAAAGAVVVNFPIPSGITTGHIYQIYRSLAVANGSVPTDEEQLVYQGSPNAADITYGQISVLDIVPEALLGAKIYTSPTQEGISQQNIIPPVANDIAVYRTSMFYANTFGLQNFTLTLLGTGSPSGIQSGDTLTLTTNGIATVFTAGSSEVTSTGTFAVAPVFASTVTATTNSSTSLTSVSSMTGIAVGQAVTGTHIPANTFVTALPGGSVVTISQAATNAAALESVTFTGDSASQAIRDTALSLVRVINRYASSTYYAYYLSGVNDLPGEIVIRARSVIAGGLDVFSLISSRTTTWNPTLPSSGTTVLSTNSTNINYLYYSKSQQPEAVPIGNYIPVGSADKAILRILALRDTLFILKEDGVFYLSGTDASNYQVWPLDYTAILIAPESAVALNNQIYALTTQGTVSITQNGVSIMSRPIEFDLNSLISKNYVALQNTSFGIAYESSRAYYLSCITNASDTKPTQYYRFNYVTSAWTHSVLFKNCGAVNPYDDKLYLGNSSLPIIDVENKALTYQDYADYQSTQTISSVSGVTVTISESDTIVVGSVIFQSATVFGFVVAVNPVLGTITTALPSELMAGAADVLAPLNTNLQWVPLSFGNAGIAKQFRETSLVFKADFNETASVGFSTDITPAVAYEIIQGGYVGAWGLSAWGGPAETPLGAVWGGDPRRRLFRIMVPRNHQRCSVAIISFAHSFAYSPWQLQGISLVGNNLSERVVN